MKCKKCGKEIDDFAKFCNFCGHKIEKSELLPLKKKKTNIIAFLIIILLGAILCLLWKGNATHQIYTSECEMSSYSLNPQNVKYDEGSGINYVDNIVIVFFDASATDNDKQSCIDSINGLVVGKYDYINQYQIEIESKNLNELKSICAELEKNDMILYATYDIAIDSKTLPDTIPTDKWGRNNVWDEKNPEGNNWWAETIQAPSAWEYNDKFNNIKIGIVDSGFDYGHEDLENKITFLSEVGKKLNNKDEHGTHVAGIIGAVANNKKGISGVVWNSELLCYDWKPTWVQEQLTDWNTETYIYGGFLRAVEAGAKVINFSLGKSGNLLDNSSDYSEEMVNKFGETASTYMASLLLNGDDFVVVQSAGNGAKDEIGVDSLNNGHFASITEDNCVTITDKVSKKDILDRIIIVGNARNEGSGKYIQSKSSNGGTQVDICAPGTDIYSTVPGDWSLFQFNGTYRKLSGTSMAAPIVTGVAALVWSVNKDLTGVEVKNIVCDEKNTIYSVEDNLESPNAVGTYRMVNAKLSVESALEYKNEDEEDTYEKEQIELTGTIFEEKWNHATSGVMNSYILKLDTPKNFILEGGHKEENVSEIQIWTDKIEEEYIGKEVKVSGKISGQAGTIYYRRNVVIWPSNISILTDEPPSPTDNSSILIQRKKDVLEISTTKDLMDFSANVNAGNNYSGKTVTLLNDIVFDSTISGNFEPIGKTDSPFSGKFEGNNHAISGLNIYVEKDYAGLFGCISGGTIQNLTLDNINLKGCSNVGAIAGGISNSTIRNCVVSGELSVSKFTTSAGITYGGIVGYSDRGSIVDCINKVSVDAKAHIGGIVGDARNSSISRCVNEGNIESSTGPCGGIVGSLGFDGTSSTVSTCHNTGTLKGDTNGLAGIVGEVHNASSVQWSYNVGSIDGFAVAGVVGLNHGFVQSCYNVGSLKARASVGGISVTCSHGGNIENCYNVGSLQGRYVGGVSSTLGNTGTKGDGGTISNCYFLDTTASQGVNKDADDGFINNIKSVSDTEMRTLAFVETLNSGVYNEENIKPWKSGEDYPVLY